ncbi:hypothetical protein B0F90DRAFT_1737509, partial [Multifurca ochricompacta]
MVELSELMLFCFTGVGAEMDMPLVSHVTILLGLLCEQLSYLRQLQFPSLLFHEGHTSFLYMYPSGLWSAIARPWASCIVNQLMTSTSVWDYLARRWICLSLVWS